MRKYIAVTVGVLTLAASCTSTDTTTEAPDEDVVVDDRAPGVTDDAIKVGVAYVDFTSLNERGITINHGDYEAAFGAVADRINDDGGIHGRTLELVFGPVDPSVDSTAPETCTSLTEDDPVFVALGRMLDDDVLCYVSVNETAVIGGTMTAERLEQANAPWFSTDPSDDLEAESARTLAEEGHLDGSVAVVGMATEQALVDDLVVPALEEQDVDVVESATIDAPPEDLAANLAAVRTIVQRFEASEADTVVVAGSAPMAFGRGLAQTSYRPKLAYTSTDDADSYIEAEDTDLSILEDAVAAAFFGPTEAQLELGGVSEECWDTQREAGLELKLLSEVPEGEPRQFVSSLYACQQMHLLSAILEAAGPELNYGTFQTAGNNLGEVVLPGSPDPWSFGAPPSADGDPPLYMFAWDPDAELLLRED